MAVICSYVLLIDVDLCPISKRTRRSFSSPTRAETISCSPARSDVFPLSSSSSFIEAKVSWLLVISAAYILFLFLGCLRNARCRQQS